MLEQPALGTLTGTAPSLIYTPIENRSGADTFTYRVSDGQVESTIATVSIAIAAVNDLPQAMPMSFETAQGTPLSIQLQGSDADGDSLQYSVMDQPANGTLTGSAPNLIYLPDSGFAGNDSFTFKANDGTVDSETTTVTINVATGPNSAPVAEPQTVETMSGQNISIILVVDDADGYTLTFSVVTQPENGTVNLVFTTPGLTAGYAPNEGFVGSDSFTYKVNDGTVDSAPATVTVNVTDAPGSTSSIFVPLAMK